MASLNRSLVFVGLGLVALHAAAGTEANEPPASHAAPKPAVATLPAHPPVPQPAPHPSTPPPAPQPAPHPPAPQPSPQPPVHQPTPQPAPQAPVTRPVSAPLPPSSSVLKLKADVGALTLTMNKYISAGNQADLDLTLVIAGIDTAVIINTDLTSIDQDSALLRDLLGVAKQVPALKEQASALLMGLEQAKPEVKEAQKVSSEACASLIPTRNTLNTIDKNIRTLVKIAGRIELALDLYSSALLKVQQCVDGLAPGEGQKTMRDGIDIQANELDAYVVKANSDLTQIIIDVNKIDRAIQGDLKRAMEPLHKLETNLDAVSRKLNALVGPLQKLEKLLKKEFSAEFPYPSPTLEDPFRFKHHTVSIGFRAILKGEKEVERELEKMLSEDLYKAAKLFGLGKLIKDIEREAMKEFDKIQGELSMNVPLEVPGLKTLHADLDAFKQGLLAIPTPNLNGQSLEDLVEKVPIDMAKCTALFADCHKK